MKPNFKVRKRYLFFSLKQYLQKRKKRYLFCGLETFLSKEKKGTFFSVTSNVLKSAKKEPLKINEVSIIQILIGRCQPLVAPTNDTQTFSGDSRSGLLNQAKPTLDSPRNICMGAIPQWPRVFDRKSSDTQYCNYRVMHYWHLFRPTHVRG